MIPWLDDWVELVLFFDAVVITYLWGKRWVEEHQQREAMRVLWEAFYGVSSYEDERS